MSVVLNFFKDKPLWDDDLHKILKKVPDLQAQLPAIRQAMLGCCGASIGKSGKIELNIADQPRWDTLAAQEATITSRIQAIDVMVAELDAIFDEIGAAGIDVPTKTPRGIWKTAPRADPPHSQINGDYINAFGKWCNRQGIPLKSEIDPKFLSWAQRAETAMQGL